MVVTRHISIDEEHIEKMRPYLEKHGGNFGAAIKEMIHQADRYNSRMSSSAIDISLFNWLLEETDDILIPDYILDELIHPMLISSMQELERYLKQRLSESGWGASISLEYDADIFPSEVLIELRGAPRKIKLIASILSQYLVKNSLENAPLKIWSVENFNECIKVELSRSDKKESVSSLLSFFGGLDEVTKAIKDRPAFWQTLARDHILSNYNMVTIHRNYFEDLLADNVSPSEVTMENIAKKPLQEIPLGELLLLIKEVYEISGIIDRVELDRENVILYHSYRTKEAVERLGKILIALLEANGHLYEAKSTANMIMLRHTSDINIKIDEILDNLKTSNSSVDKELVKFLISLKGLKDIPDIPLSLTVLGRRMGSSLMQEYEKENDIKEWDLETFKKALELIDSRLGRMNELRMDGGTLKYTVRKCNIATEGNEFDAYICSTLQEALKGALNYALGNKAEIAIKKSNGDNFCEVVIRTL